MEKLLYIWALGKVTEFVKKNIYKTEIVNAGKKGMDKFNAIAEDFWNKAEKYIIKEKEIDRKLIPDALENFGEEAIHNVLKLIKDELEPKKLIQEIFDIEKSSNPNIF